MIELAINGVFVGALYALFGLGLAITFGLMKTDQSRPRRHDCAFCVSGMDVRHGDGPQSAIYIASCRSLDVCIWLPSPAFGAEPGDGRK